jgi:hypothetical protein
MTVWLWEAGSGRGVSDDLSRACAAASACLRGGQADSARVERALLLAGGNWLTSGYHRTGVGWLAQPRRDGGVSWVPLDGSPVLVSNNGWRSHGFPARASAHSRKGRVWVRWET